MPLIDKKVKTSTYNLLDNADQVIPVPPDVSFYLLINGAGDRLIINGSGDLFLWKQ